jgi:hypothetical protein
VKRRISQLRIASVKWALSVGIWATTLVTVSPAFAALGEPASSVQADKDHLQGTCAPRKPGLTPSTKSAPPRNGCA